MLPHFFNFVCRGYERGTIYNAEYNENGHDMKISWQHHNGFELVQRHDYYDIDDVVEYVNDGVWIILSPDIEDALDVDMAEVI